MNAFAYCSSRLRLFVLLAASLHAAVAGASDGDAPTLSFSGFGTLGAANSSERKADFAESSIRPNGAGYTSPWSAGVDSRLGAQASAIFTPRLSAVLQVIVEQRYDNTYTPTVEWANIKYQFTPDTSLRAGRIVLPTFLVSDYRKVGYANPWVRPPVEVYSLIPISNSDGVDASHRMRAGNFTSTLQGTYGSTEAKLPGGGTAKAKDAWGLSYTGEYGATTVHVAYESANVTLNAFQPLFDGFRQFGAQGNAIADRYDPVAKPFTFIGVGAIYDPGDWFAMGEWGGVDNHSAFGRKSAWYATVGGRLAAFTPYLTYAQARADNDTSDSGLSLAGLPPGAAAAAAGLNAGLDAVLKLAPVQKTISVGLRWDFAPNADVKLQFDHTRLGAGSAGTLVNVQPGFAPGGSFNVFSATLDFVF